MLHLRERWVHFFELHVSSEPEGAPPVPFADLVPFLLPRIAAGDAFQLRNDNQAAFRILDARYDSDIGQNGALILLLQYADKNATDPSFAHLETGAIRTEPKLDGEGVAVSAHVVIDLQPIDGTPNAYRFLLESAPGLGRSSTGPFLKKQCKEASKNNFTFTDEATRRQRGLRIAPEILGVPSQSFIDEASHGRIEGIELIKHIHEDHAIDEDGYFREKTYGITIGFSVIGNALDKALDSLRGYGRDKGYDELKVRYKKSNGKHKSVILGTTQEDLMDTLVLKDELIVSDHDLQQSSPMIVDSFAQSMLDIMFPAVEPD